MAHGRHSFRYTVAILSAIAIWIACLLQALQSFDLTGGVQPNFRDQAYQNNTRTLDPGTLRAYFNWKNGQRGVDVAIDLFASAGLGGLAYTVLVLKRVFRRHKGGDSDLPNLMSACFFYWSSFAINPISTELRLYCYFRLDLPIKRIAGRWNTSRICCNQDPTRSWSVHV